MMRKLVNTLPLLILIGGIIYVYLYLEDTGKIDDWFGNDDQVEIVSEVIPSSNNIPENDDRGSPSKEIVEQQMTEINIYSLEKQIHVLINDIREREGLLALDWDGALSAITSDHSQDMIDRAYFSHTTPDGDGPVDRCKQADFDINRIPAGGFHYYLGCSENIFQCSLEKHRWFSGDVYSHSDYYTQEEIASLAVEGWMNSPGHRENILKEYWESEGIGIAISDEGAVYITQNFN